MVSIAIDLTKSILEKLMNATIEQSRYICCFTCIAEDFEKEKESLKAKRSTVEKKVKVANKRAEDILPEVTFWQEQADKLIQEDTITRMTCFFGWCPNCKWLYRRGKELANKTQEMKTLIMEESKFESVGIPRDLPDVEYYSSQHYISFKSREFKYKELLEALTDDNNYMIGLQGMGGTGKTTLAKEVGKELKKSKKFDQVIDTTVSYTPDIKKIQDDIAGPLGLSWDNCTESERHKKLRSRLTNGEKILIILDDVWGDINFEEIGIPKKDNQRGCIILVTTRNLRICNSMGCDKKIQLELLPEEDAWMLLKKHAGLTDSSPKSILDTSHKIAKECKGLPIAIAVIASSLKDEQRQEEWNVALKSLQKSTPQHEDDETLGEIYQCLRYSYDNMKNKTAKELFLLCSVFQEDEEISVEILTRFSIGAGLVGEIDDNYYACRNKVLVAKNKLIDSCLLLKTKNEEHVKMHDLVREVALWIANEEIKAMKISNKNPKPLVEGAKNLKYLLCEGKGMDVFSFKFDGSKLEILIVCLEKDENDFVEVSNSFFEKMKGLRVLYLSHKAWGDPTLSLPQSIQSLTNIRSLWLESFLLGDITILGNLRCLETLDLVSCSMDELPCEIAELEKLKLLNLCCCEFNRNNPFKVIENCSSLEELYFIGSNFPMDSSTMHQKVTLPKLQRFQIMNRIFQYKAGRNCLTISKVEDIFSEVTLKHLVQKAEFLILFELHGRWRNFIPEMSLPEDEGTLNLVELRLAFISQPQCLIDTEHINSCAQNVFSKLVVLELQEMENLKELCSGPLPFELLKCLEQLKINRCIHLQGILFKSKITLCNLKSLDLNDCPMLTSLFQMSTAQSLVLLEYLSIWNCAQLKSIIQDERTGEDLGEEIVDGDNDNKPGGSMFPKLKSLNIYKCPQLDFILPVVAALGIPKLEDIEIDDCVELKYIFGPNQHKHEKQDLHQELKEVMFVTLKRMTLKGLPNFVDIFPECEQSMCLSMKRSCSKDGSETQKELDPIKCNIFPWTRKYRHKLRTTKIPLDSKDQLQDCSLSPVVDSKVNDLIGQEMIVSLENIKLSDMPQMTCLFVGPKIFFTLQNVAMLIIGQCEKMKVLFSASMIGCLPQLHTLGIFGCNDLNHIIDGDTKNQKISFFPKLKVLVIRECNNLKCVFPISTSKMLPKLEVLVIREASMLEEIFRWESDKKVEIPNLKLAVLVELPSLCQGIEFHIEDCFVKNCPNLSLTSTPTLERIQQIFSDSTEGFEYEYWIKERLWKTLELLEDSNVQEISDQNPTAKTNEDFPMGAEVQAASGSELTSSQVNTNQSIDANIAKYNQHENDIESNEFVSAETQTKETLKAGQEFGEKVPDLEIPLIEISPKDSELIRRPSQCPLDIPLHETHSHGIKRSFEEGTTSTFAETIALSTGSESGHGEGQTTIPSISVVNTKLATTEDVDVGDIQDTSKSAVIHFETNASENLSQITEDSGFASKVTRELEQLVSNKHLALENLSLLTNFLVKHPSVHLTDNAVSDRYKGFAYTCLAELLKFLQTHSVLDALGPSHSEFVKLLEDVRRFGFDRDWLNI